MKGNLNNFDKETKTHLSNLKAAIILLENSKTPIISKIKTLQDENKELQKSIKELKNEKQQLLNQIKKLEKGGG
jgi:chromosome segregation ATPase